MGSCPEGMVPGPRGSGCVDPSPTGNNYRGKRYPLRRNQQPRWGNGDAHGRKPSGLRRGGRARTKFRAGRTLPRRAQRRPNGGGGGGSRTCMVYTNEASCINAGCDWCYAAGGSPGYHYCAEACPPPPPGSTPYGAMDPTGTGGQDYIPSTPATEDTYQCIGSGMYGYGSNNVDDQGIYTGCSLWVQGSWWMTFTTMAGCDGSSQCQNQGYDYQQGTGGAYWNEDTQFGGWCSCGSFVSGQSGNEGQPYIAPVGGW